MSAPAPTPIVVATNGNGLRVTEAANGQGLPVVKALNGFGIPVVIVASGGFRRRRPRKLSWYRFIW
jgi:hypothetical protein